MDVNSAPNACNAVGFGLIVIQIDMHKVCGLVALPVRVQLEHHLVKLTFTEINSAIFHDTSRTCPTPRTIVGSSFIVIRNNQLRIIDVKDSSHISITLDLSWLFEHRAVLEG